MCRGHALIALKVVELWLNYGCSTGLDALSPGILDGGVVVLEKGSLATLYHSAFSKIF